MSAVEHPARVTAWANGFGVWHVRVNIGDVPEQSSGAVIIARGALRDELTARENNVARDVWMHPVRLPELDTDGTVVYRERFLDTDPPHAP